MCLLACLLVCLYSSWTELHLIKEGLVVPEAEQHFPATLSVLHQVNALLAHPHRRQHSNLDGSGSGFADPDPNPDPDPDPDPDETLYHIINARLSSLQPGTHIAAHCGVTNTKLRAHLPLQVPVPSYSTASTSRSTTTSSSSSSSSTRSRRRSGLRVGSAPLKQWTEGKLLVFDDSFEHEVWWEWESQPQSQTQSQSHKSSFGDATGDTNTNTNTGANPNTDTDTGVVHTINIVNNNGVGIRDDIIIVDNVVPATLKSSSGNGNGNRVVLIVDVFHPQVPLPMRRKLKASFGADNTIDGRET